MYGVLYVCCALFEGEFHFSPNAVRVIHHKIKKRENILWCALRYTLIWIYGGKKLTFSMLFFVVYYISNFSQPIVFKFLHAVFFSRLNFVSCPDIFFLLTETDPNTIIFFQVMPNIERIIRFNAVAEWNVLRCIWMK